MNIIETIYDSDNTVDSDIQPAEIENYSINEFEIINK